MIITSKAFQVLLVLLRHSGRVVDKEIFLREVWPDTFVEESTLAQNILTLRKAFAKHTTKVFIVTAPRRGYRFVEKVEEISFGENGVESLGNYAGQGSVPRDDLFRLATRSTRFVKISPDGTKLACCLWDPKTDRVILVLVSAPTGKVLAYPITPRNDDIPFVDWSGDGKHLYAVLRRAKPVSLWKIPVNGGQPVQLREWEDEVNLRLAISKEGQKVFYEIGMN